MDYVCMRPSIISGSSLEITLIFIPPSSHSVPLCGFTVLDILWQEGQNLS